MGSNLWHKSYNFLDLVGRPIWASPFWQLLIRIWNSHLEAYAYDTWSKFYIFVGYFPIRVSELSYVYDPTGSIWYAYEAYGQLYIFFLKFSTLGHTRHPFLWQIFSEFSCFPKFFFVIGHIWSIAATNGHFFFFILWFWRVYLSWAPREIFFFAGQ